MQASKDRILTTHVGSLPRSERLLKMLSDMETGAEVDRAEFVAQARIEMTQAVQMQAAKGIDVAGDGEIPRLGFSIYAKNDEVVVDIGSPNVYIVAKKFGKALVTKWTKPVVDKIIITDTKYRIEAKPFGHVEFDRKKL